MSRREEGGAADMNNEGGMWTDELVSPQDEVYLNALIRREVNLENIKG